MAKLVPINRVKAGDRIVGDSFGTHAPLHVVKSFRTAPRARSWSITYRRPDETEALAVFNSDEVVQIETA